MLETLGSQGTTVEDDTLFVSCSFYYDLSIIEMNSQMVPACILSTELTVWPPCR